MKKLKIGQAYIIEWYDHSSFATATWRTLEEHKNQETFSIKSIGYLLEQKKDKIVIASTISNNWNALMHDFTILTAVIKSIKPIKGLYIKGL